MKTEKNIVTVEVAINASPEKVWDLWTLPEHVVNWNNASADWHTTHATNDLRPNGSFSFRMEAKDGSFGFDFGGKYDEVIRNRKISYTLGDSRKVNVSFTREGDKTLIVEEFEAETQNSPELQKLGWQAILDNFRKYAESIKQ